MFGTPVNGTYGTLVLLASYHRTVFISRTGSFWSFGRAAIGRKTQLGEKGSPDETGQNRKKEEL